MSAIAATLGIGSLAVAAIYYRFAMHMAASGGEFPLGEAAATLLLTMGGAVCPWVLLSASPPPRAARAPHRAMRLASRPPAALHLSRYACAEALPCSLGAYSWYLPSSGVPAHLRILLKVLHFAARVRAVACSQYLQGFPDVHHI
jgi:hypothetical protein